jgi:hypothetical protein
MIPMMILSGAMFPFDKLNRSISSVEQVPFIAEIMPTKWSYEALMVNQFKNNKYEQHFYDLEKKESQANFKTVYFLPELKKKVKFLKRNLDSIETVPSIRKQAKHDLALLRNELGNEMNKTGLQFGQLNVLNTGTIDKTTLTKTMEFIKRLDKHYNKRFTMANQKLDNIRSYYTKNKPKAYRRLKDNYYNESVADYVKKVMEKNKIIEYKDKLIQHVDPVFNDPEPRNILDFRTHFYAPRKYFLGTYFSTYWFNLSAIFVMTLILYITLYYGALYKLLNLPHEVKKIFFRKS